MLIAEFSRRGEEIEIDDELWQYDYGQKIQIKGLNLPEIFEVHFSWKDLEKAKVVTGSTIDGISTVDIPNIALEQRRMITAYEQYREFLFRDRPGQCISEPQRGV